MIKKAALFVLAAPLLSGAFVPLSNALEVPVGGTVDARPCDGFDHCGLLSPQSGIALTGSDFTLSSNPRGLETPALFTNSQIFSPGQDINLGGAIDLTGATVTFQGITYNV